MPAPEKKKTPTLTLEDMRLRNRRYQDLWAPTRYLALEKSRRGARD